jgi:multidrug efflux pump subunit AcrA (membrane-fusion protein)
MKKLILLSTLAISIIACNKGGDEKKDELEKLKKQELELKAKIATLEASMNEGKDTIPTGIAISVQTLKAETFKNYIDIQGRVDADENVSVSSEIPGTIVKINVKVGDEVSKLMLELLVKVLPICK